MLHRNNLIDAAFHVIALRGECAHRTGRETRSLVTRVAGMRMLGVRQVYGVMQKDGRAVGVPEAVFRMDLDPDGRRVHALRTLRPALERPIRRPVEGIERGSMN